MHYSVDVVDKPSKFAVIRKAKDSNSHVGIFLLGECSYCLDLAQCQAWQQNARQLLQKQPAMWMGIRHGKPCGVMVNSACSKVENRLKIYMAQACKDQLL